MELFKISSRSFVASLTTLLFGPWVIYEYYKWNNDGLVFTIAIMLTILLFLINLLRRIQLIEVADGASGILARMRLHWDNENAQLLGTRVLLELVNRRLIDYTKLLIDLDGVNLLLEMATMYLKNPEILENTIEILFVMDKNNPKCREKLGKYQNITNTITIMQSKRGMESCTILWKCCILIGSIAERNTFGQNYIGKANGVQAVIRAMKQYPQHTKIQQWGCRALFNFSYENADMKQMLDTHDGIQQVINAMINHPTHLEINRLGCVAIGNCIVGLPKDITFAFVKCIRNAGGFPVISHAMSEFSNCKVIKDMGTMIMETNCIYSRVHEQVDL